jgi:hypothetical protein
MIIKPNQHLLFVGQTGTGKTFCAESLSNEFQNVIALDTKGFMALPFSKDVKIINDFDKLQKVKDGSYIYRPPIGVISSKEAETHYNEFFKWIYYRQNTIVIIDELMEITSSASQYPDWLRGLYTRGRQKNIGVWGCSQRPKTIPRFCISESTHLFVFDLNIEDDRKVLVENSGYTELAIKPSKISKREYTFWYIDISKPNHQPRIKKIEIK